MMFRRSSFSRYRLLQHLHGVDGQLQVVLHSQDRFGQPDLPAPFPVQDVALGDLAVPLAHQDRFHHVLNRFHVEGLVLILFGQPLNDDLRQACGDRAGLGRILENLEGRPVDGVLDLFRGKGDDRPVPSLSGMAYFILFPELHRSLF